MWVVMIPESEIYFHEQVDALAFVQRIAIEFPEVTPALTFEGPDPRPGEAEPSKPGAQ